MPITPNFSIDLTGDVALVTGASSGLGRRFAQVLASAGAAVAVTGRRQDRIEALADDIRADGGKALAVVLDVRDAAAISAAIDLVQRELGLINILVNNAGIADANWATKLPLQLIDDVIATNLRAPFLISCEVARRLIEANKPGRIVNLSSSGAFQYSANSAAALYCATKAGISRLTETLAMEWARFGINVNAIAPGLFRSEMSEGFLQRNGDKVISSFQRKRVGEAHQLDSTLLYLVSQSSEFVTGVSILVDDAQVSR
jgi:NAD(P)-dependent dehydrogenase (short-subunit alcohol dehydrogenase family)